MNIKEFEALQKKLEKAEADYKYAVDYNDKELIRQKGNAWEEIKKCEGPASGFFYDEDTNQFKISKGWHVDATGEIVRD